MIIKADPWYDAMSKKEMEEFLSKPLLMRLGVIDRDGYPLVHPVWFVYRDDEFFILSNRKSKKVMLIKNDGRVYYTIDLEKPTGVRGKGDAIIIDDNILASNLMKDMILRYIGDTESEISRMLEDEAKESVVIRIKPRFFATWIHR